MGNKYFLIKLISISILIININKYKSSYITCGINQLNNFIYSDRLKQYIIQNINNKCSLENGPNCYYSEMKRSKEYELENTQINNDNPNSKEILDFNKQWMNIFKESLETNYINTYYDLSTNIAKYEKYIRAKNDSAQIPLPINLHLRLTFESYDEYTKKGDTYALPSKPVKFFTENIYIEIFGRLRLHYGEDLKLKNVMKYPSGTYGIIESTNLIIRLGNKLFICEYFFVRLREQNIYKIKIEGYLGKINSFTVEKDLKAQNKNTWTKITLPHSQIDRILIPGGIEVDNFNFIIETTKQYDISVHFHSNHRQRIDKLIKDSDIY